MLRSGLLLALACALCAPAVARADADADAKSHFKAARDAYRQADYAQAITEFEAAYAAKPSGVIRFNIAQCFEKLGDLPGALLNYRRYLRETPTAPDRRVVEKAMVNLEKRLQDLGVQQLAVFSKPAGAAVDVDGNRRGSTPLSIELAPGQHVVDLQLGGFQTVRREVLLAADKSLEVDATLSPGLSKPPEPLAMAAPAAQAAPAKPKTEVKAAPPSRTPVLRIASYATAGVGVALLGLGVLENAQVGSDNSSISGGKGSVQGNYDDAKTAAGVRNAAYIVGAAAVAAGAAMFFLSSSEPPKTTAALAPTSGGMAAVVTRQF